MSETEVTVFSGWDQIKQSLKGFLIGILLIPASFIVVYIASQREQASEVLENALALNHAGKAATEKKAVHASGKIKARPLGDPIYVKPGPYLKLSRSGQIYAWVQQKETKTEKQGTKKVEKTTYDCEEEWTSSPDLNIGSKKGCSGKYNYPRKYFKDASFSARVNLDVGGKDYTIDSSVNLIGMPTADINKENLTQPLHQSDKYFYHDSRCAENTTIGCERVSFSATTYDSKSDHTVIGTPAGRSMKPYVSDEDNKYLYLGPGTFSNVLDEIASQDAMWTWILFGISVLLMGGGLSLLVGPLLQLIEFIPFIGGFGAGLIRVIFFIFAFFIMGLTFLLIEYWYVVLILFLILLILIIVIVKKRKGEAPAAA